MMMVVDSQGSDREDDRGYTRISVFFEELGYETCIAEQVIRLTGRFSFRTADQLEEISSPTQKEHAKI